MSDSHYTSPDDVRSDTSSTSSSIGDPTFEEQILALSKVDLDSVPMFNSDGRLNPEYLKVAVAHEYAKPVEKAFSVTNLVTCTQFQPVNQFALEMGKKRHESIQSQYTAEPSSPFIVEVPIAVNVDGVLVKGRMDILDTANMMVYEIKPFKLFPAYVRQLSLYIMMMRKLTGINFMGGFVLYRGEHFVVERAMMVDTTVIDNVVHNVKEGKLIISGEYCEICGKNGRCPKPFTWRKAYESVPVDTVTLF